MEFENRAWAPFMDQVVHAVCDALGVNFDASRPRCDLYKLLLYEEGSQCVNFDYVTRTLDG